MNEEGGSAKEYPSPFQKKIVWGGLTSFFMVVIGAIAVGLIWLFTRTMGILQPVLVPLAVAGVIAYLLYPLVEKLIARGLPQKKASLAVFFAFMVAGALLITAIAIPASRQAAQLVRDFPGYIKKFEQTLDKGTAALEEDYRNHFIFGPLIDWLPEMRSSDSSRDEPDTRAANEAGVPAAQGALPRPIPEPLRESVPVSNVTGPNPDGGAAGTADSKAKASFDPGNLRSWLLEQLPVIATRVWEFVRKSVGGFLGAFGFLIGFLLVPIYLFFFLREAPNIRATWSDYIPLRASEFKDEVVGTLSEINGYLIAFFRGQMLVSLIDGLVTAVVLSILGLKFGLLLGVLVGLLGVIPYLGILMVYLPSVIIATVQGANHDWYMSHDASWWVLPLVVTFVFIAVNNLDGILIAPKIVGDSVGLHPFTIIFSVLFWSLLLGGLLGALLAVPLTASVKVLFRRYIWERRVKPGAQEGGAPPGDEPEAPAPAA